MTETSTPARPRVVPPLLRWAFTAFMVVLVPTYWLNYGPTNFLYFCDASLFLALVSVWRNDPLPASMAAVGLLVPQTVWVFNLVGTLIGVPLTHITDYRVAP